MSLWLVCVLIFLGGVLIYLGVREVMHQRRVSQLQSFEITNSAPESIKLEACEQFGWLIEPEVQHSLRELETFGFVQLGTFRVVEMPGLHVIGLIQRERRFIACVYADQRGVTWVDISAQTVDGQICTTSNSLNDDLVHAQTRGALRVDKSWSIAELYAQQMQECADRTLTSVHGISFAELFERSYEADMRWQNEKDGTLRAPAWDSAVH